MLLVCSTLACHVGLLGSQRRGHAASHAKPAPAAAVPPLISCEQAIRRRSSASTCRDRLWTCLLRTRLRARSCPRSGENARKAKKFRRNI
jgi:hypothetical protein